MTHAAALDASVGMPQPAHLGDAVSLLSGARRPAMLIGKGARWSEPSALLRRLADEYAIPFATSPMGRGLLPDDHPLCFSAVRGRMLADADVVLMVGARFNWTFRFGTEISTSAQIVRIDVDPVEAAEVLGRGVGLQGDASWVLQHVLGTLDANTPIRPVARDTEWLNDLKTLRATFAPGVVPAAELGLQPMSPYEWLGELNAVMPDNAITVLDGNVVMTAAQRMLSVRHPATRLGPGTNGCMGTGVPFAIGAKLARPDLPVIAIVGDFAFGLSALEVETALRYHVPVVLMVANNGGPGGATRQRKVFPANHPERVLQFVPGIRHDLMMASFGGLGLRIDGPGQIGSALNDALASNRPVCIDIVTNENTGVAAAI
jgi:thiamine pyrophosphate-dependent acetolactate synthase large subunit-like protein